MKTQINTLVHGHLSTTGTNSHDRAAIAAKVIEENPRELNVELSGHKLTLYAHYSLSGKSVTYIGNVTQEEVIIEVSEKNHWPFAQNTIEAMRQGLAYVNLQIQGNMMADLQIYHRRNDRCLWKHSMTLRVEESTITII